jgi:hypothetical protein
MPRLDVTSPASLVPHACFRVVHMQHTAISSCEWTTVYNCVLLGVGVRVRSARKPLMEPICSCCVGQWHGWHGWLAGWRPAAAALCPALPCPALPCPAQASTCTSLPLMAADPGQQAGGSRGPKLNPCDAQTVHRAAQQCCYVQLDTVSQGMHACRHAWQWLPGLHLHTEERCSAATGVKKTSLFRRLCGVVIWQCGGARLQLGIVWWCCGFRGNLLGLGWVGACAVCASQAAWGIASIHAPR